MIYLKSPLVGMCPLYKQHPFSKHPVWRDQTNKEQSTINCWVFLSTKFPFSRICYITYILLVSRDTQNWVQKESSNTVTCSFVWADGTAYYYSVFSLKYCKAEYHIWLKCLFLVVSLYEVMFCTQVFVHILRGWTFSVWVSSLYGNQLFVRRSTFCVGDHIFVEGSTFSQGSIFIHQKNISIFFCLIECISLLLHMINLFVNLKSFWNLHEIGCLDEWSVGQFQLLEERDALQLKLSASLRQTQELSRELTLSHQLPPPASPAPSLHQKWVEWPWKNNPFCRVMYFDIIVLMTESFLLGHCHKIC